MSVMSFGALYESISRSVPWRSMQFPAVTTILDIFELDAVLPTCTEENTLADGLSIC
jgi:hypothetical protein